ncbi:hypothetical protein [Aurantibacillus circumpalustris]|uniref:hypothetical protein n=1 Tax=Aurantibacillus circumpalustris TaxID=3036359 RepID=UPI00295ADD0C|nr:hypothetical protein [Aurantibacillus circumpalustris]
MKLGIRFFLSWIFSALVMFGLFYIWHGIFLNDFKRIQFPLTWFVTFAAFTYLIFGAGIYFLFESSLLKKIRNFFIRGLICGGVAGFSLFMIATIVHISLTTNLSAQHLMMDCIWQIAEQTLGAMVVVLFKVVIHEPQLEHA